MIKMPAPVSVPWVPTGSEHGTFQLYDAALEETPSTMAGVWITQFALGPLQSTKLTVEPSAGWGACHVIWKFWPVVTGWVVSGRYRAPNVALVGAVNAEARPAKAAAATKDFILNCSDVFDCFDFGG